MGKRLRKLYDSSEDPQNANAEIDVAGVDTIKIVDVNWKTQVLEVQEIGNPTALKEMREAGGRNY